MWYKNIAGRFFGLGTKHACDRRTDGQNYDSQDRASIARAVKMHSRSTLLICFVFNTVYFTCTKQRTVNSVIEIGTPL